MKGAEREAAVLCSRGASAPLTPEPETQRKTAYVLDFLAALEEKTGR